MKNEIKTCIIIQGPTKKEYVEHNKKCWDGFPIIFSTWEDSNKTAYDLDNDIVLFNEYPEKSGVGNWNYQRVSSLNGIKLAKELGYNRVLKWRSDFMTNNGIELYKLFDVNKINFYAFIPHDDGYITDYFFEGDIDKIYNILSDESDGVFAEKIMTKSISDLNLLNETNFVCKKLNKNADVYWHKLEYWLSQNNNLDTYSDKLGEIIFKK